MSDLRFQKCLAIPLALTLTLPFLHAQSPDRVAPSLDPQHLDVGLSAIAPGVDGPGGLWAAGPDYKVSLHDGFVFMPYVGPTLPHQPLRWRTVSAQLGGIELQSRDACAPTWSALRCEYDLGGIVECYELREGGVEQSFVIELRPADGDLVIEGLVDSPLELTPQTWQRAPLQLRLPDDGRAVIEYGAATAIDALGREFPVDTSCKGSTIRLRLAAEHVRVAQFPLVVDPLIRNVMVGAGAPMTGVDILYESLSQIGSQARTWIAYSRAVAAGDEDVFVLRLAAGLNGTPTEVHREISAWSADHPRMALAPDARKVVIVYASGPVGPNPQRLLLIHSHLVDDNFLRTTTHNPFGTLNDNDWRPDVGGRLNAGDEVVVVWQREAGMPFANSDHSAVWAGVFDANSNSASVPGFVVRNRPNQDQERPVVNRAADADEWLLAFQSHDGRVANDDWDIRLFAIDALGNAPDLGIDVTQEANPLLHKLGPQVAGSDGRYCLIYTTRPFSLPQPKPTTLQGRSIWAQRIDVDHANDVGSLPHAVVQLDSLRSDDLTIGGVAFDHVSASHFALSTRNLGSGECRVRKLGYQGVEVENFVVDPGTQTTLRVGGVAFNGSRREFLHGFGGNDGSATGNELLAARLTYDQVTPPVTYGIGCGAGIFAELTEMESKQQIGSQGIAFVLNHAPFDGAGYLLMSTGTANIPMALYGMPGCELLVDPAAGVFLGVVDATITAGNARVVLDVPETIAPLRVTAQWLYAAPGANLAGLQASTGLDLSLAR